MSRGETLLLDTHVWLWAYHGELSRVGRHVPRLIDEGLDEGRLHVSAVSAWEVAQLATRGRVVLRAPLRDWMERARAAFGGRLVPLDGAAAVESELLPVFPYRDPADRFLVATARALGARLVTCDARLLAYGDAGHVRTLDARP